MTKVSDNKLIIRNTIFLTIRMVFVLLVTLYTSRVLLRVLGVEDFGVYNVVAGFVSMFAFLHTSMTNAIQRFFNYEFGKNGIKGANVVYNTSLFIQAFVAVIIVLFTETFGLWYLYYKMVVPPERLTAAFWIFQFSILSLVFMVFQVPYRAVITAYERMDFSAFVGILDAILKLIIAIILPYVRSDQLIAYGFLLLLISVINWGLYYIYTKINFKDLRFRIQFHKSMFKDMISFSLWNFFGTFSSVMREQGVNMVLNLFYGPVINAARGIAYQVSGALTGLVHNITNAARPQMVQSYAMGNVNRTINIMFGISKLVYLSLFLLSVPVILEVDYILKIWLGDYVPEHTNNFFILTIIASLIRTLHPMTSHVVQATGKIVFFQLVNGIIDLSIVFVAYLFCYWGYKPEYVFLLYIIANVIVQIICWFILQSLVSEFSVTDYVRKVVLPITMVSIISFILPYIAHAWFNIGFLRLVIVTLLSFISTIFLSYYIGLNSKEREKICDYCYKRFKIRL